MVYAIDQNRILQQISFVQKKHFLSLLVALLGLLIVARPTFILLTHDFQAEADNAYFIFKHVKKRKQDFDEQASAATLERLQTRFVKYPPTKPSRFIAASTQPALHWCTSSIPAPVYDILAGSKTYLLTGKLSI